MIRKTFPKYWGNVFFVGGSMKEKRFNEEEILEAIKNYIEDTVYPYALMITGEWGSGKTYFIKNNVISGLQQKKFVYISLYGISSIEEINKLVFMNIILGSEKSNKMEKVIEPGVNLLAGIVKPFIPVPDVIKDKKNIENIMEIFTKNFKIENIVFVFDDLERCSCPIEEIFGYLNTFIEQNKNKIILIANEKEIGSQSYEKNNGKKKEDDLVNHYLLIKEKLVGITLHFHPNMKKVMASIVTNNDKIPKKLLNELNKNLNKIEEVMNENGHTNLRTFQFYLSKLNLLYQVIKDEVYNNEEVYKKINIEILEACMKLKKGKEIGIDPGKFQFVPQYVEENFCSEDEVLTELRKFDERLTFEKKDPEDSMAKLKYFDFVRDNDVESAMSLAIERLERNEESVYTKENYLDMLNTFLFYVKKIGIGEEYVEKLEALIPIKFEIEETDTYKYQFPDNPVKEEFKNSIIRIRNQCKAKKESEIKQQLEECLSKENWTKELRSIIGIKFDSSEKRKISFMDKINMQSLVEKIKKSEAEQMKEFKDIFHWVYSEKQEIDVELLQKLKRRLEEEKEHTEEKMKKYHMNSIVQEIGEDIKLQNILNYSGE